MTDESGILRDLIEAAVRGRVIQQLAPERWREAWKIGREAADEVLQALQIANVSVVQMHALGLREEE